MKSDWTQEFREKFEGYRPDIPIPPFAIRTRRSRKTVYWIATAAVAATVTAVFYLAGSYTYNKGQIQAGHLIGEASPVIRSAFEWKALPIKDIKLFDSPKRLPVSSSYETIPISELSLDCVTDTISDTLQRPTDGQDLGQIPGRDNGPHFDDTNGDNPELPSTPLNKTIKRFSTRVMIAPQSLMSSYEKTQGLGIADVISDEDISSKWSFKAGISFGYEILPSLVIESGLVYSNHSIHMRFIDADNSVFETGFLQLQYLGLPLKLNVKMLNTNKISIYGSAGGEASWLMASRVKEAYGHAGYNQALRGKPLLLSLIGGVGLGYDLSSTWSVYLEPCVTYSYMPSGQVAYYASHPFGFDIALGIRFDF